MMFLGDVRVKGSRTVTVGLGDAKPLYLIGQQIQMRPVVVAIGPFRVG